MSSFTFFIRTMILTFVVVMILQVRWGATTLEDHTMTFLTSSAFVQPVNQAARGTVVLIRNTWSQVTKSINTNFTNALRRENQPGSRQEGFSISRSQEYIKQSANSAGRAARELAQEYDPEVAQAKQTSMSIYEKFKKQAGIASKRVRSKFIDETEVPGQPDTSSASSTNDDEMIEE